MAWTENGRVHESTPSAADLVLQMDNPLLLEQLESMERLAVEGLRRSPTVVMANYWEVMLNKIKIAILYAK